LSQLMDAGTLVAAESLLLPPRLQELERLSHWYAVYTSPRHEKRVREYLGLRGVECFLPLFRSIHRWKNGCKAQVELPLFPGYLFVNIPRSERVRVLDVPGVLSFVGPRREPARLPDVEIETLRSGLHLQRFEPYHNLIVGQKVRIKAGSLTGLVGVLVRSANGFRVVLTVELIKQSVAVELDGADVEPIAPHSSAPHVSSPSYC
jgi:transcription antitermination factor NusG